MSSEVNDEYKSWATIKEGYSFYCQDLYVCPCGKYLWKTSFLTICGANLVRTWTIFKDFGNSVWSNISVNGKSKFPTNIDKCFEKKK